MYLAPCLVCMCCLLAYPDGFHGDVYLLFKLLLPGVSKRVYNLQSRQIVKLLSQVFHCSLDDMIEDLDQVTQ